MATHQHERDPNLLPPADWAGEIERMQEELQNERDRHLRTLADFKNYRRNIERDGNKIADQSSRKIFLSLLDIIDDIDQVLLSTNEEERPLAKGVALIHHKFLALLEKEDVRPFESVGKRFDPELHHAVAVVERKGIERGTIIDDLRRGYYWKNQLLRPAQVRVSE